MKIIFDISRWFIGLICCLAAFGGFLNGDTGPALLILVLGLFLLPPVSKAIFKKIHQGRIDKYKINTAKDFLTAPKRHLTESQKTGDDKTDLSQSDNRSVARSTLRDRQSEQIMTVSNDKEIFPKVLSDEDFSIIDVTGQDYKIKDLVQNAPKQESTLQVPYWAHQYVYQYSEIKSATREQINFYHHYKKAFLSGNYLDLKGNTNYAFILLFDLLNNDYEYHKDLGRLENQLNELGFHYPKTNSYATSFLIKKMEAAGDYAGVERLNNSAYHGYYGNGAGYDYWRLGNKYKEKLTLTDIEFAQLNKIGDPGNNFCSIESCLLAVIRLYLASLKGLESKLPEGATSLEELFITISDIIARKYFRYRKNSTNYNYSVESTSNELYAFVFKYCENAVREHFGHKRKISADFTYSINAEVAAAVEDKIVGQLKSIHPKLLSAIDSPDMQTEIELNIRNTSRWKSKFEELTAGYKVGEGKQFIKDIQALGLLNQKNPSLENIYFEASKFMTKSDAEAALILYVHYLYHDLQSVTFNNKQLAKTLQKSLFKTEQQLQGFQTIVEDLIKYKNLENAIGAIPGLFSSKRKRITLDTQVINTVQQQHASTVELLNGFLQDEEDLLTKEPKKEPVSTQDLEISFQNLISPTKASDDFFVEGLSLDSSQRDLLRLFFTNEYSVPKREVETFSKANGLMRNQLIDSINDCCQDLLDDVLIEEEDDQYTIYDNYFQKLIKND